MSETNPAARPEPTEIAGRYQVLKKLGAGAMGTVYKAKDKVLGRMVAIKTIRLEGLAAASTSLDDLLKRFQKEAEVAAQLKHPNIVTIYDIGTAQGLSYISMEFVDGIGLDRAIASSGKMPVERAAAIGAQVADALAFAHKHQSVVHRDIKPANIMLEAGDRVKVTDFGIAKVTDSADHLTVTGSLLGTPSYMSPEQARGGQIDGRSDLFSLGCVLYEMVAGQKAFRGESITALIFKIITEQPRPLRELDPNVPDEAIRIIAKALAKAPDSRYQTGRELADDLLALMRPGSTPTLRAAESPTLPSDPASPVVATVVSPGTARVEPTISSSETAARPKGALSTQPAPGGPPPLPPTVLTPATLRTPAPARRPAPARPSQAGVPTGAAARKGGGTGLLVGLGVVGILVVAVGGFFLLAKRNPAPVAAPVVEGPSETTSSSPPAEAAPGAAGETTAEAALSPPASASTSEVPAPPPPASAPRPAAPGPLARGAEAPSGQGSGGAAAGGEAGARSSPAAASAAAGEDYSYLDEIPPEAPDGRAIGESLAGKYRSGGSAGYSTRRFKRRERFPRDLIPAERPAAATLGYILVAQEKFHARHGRYGTLAELAAAQHLFLDVPIGADGFQRARYRFTLTLQGDGFRAQAKPIGPAGRPLLVDDSGFVRVDLD